MTQFMELNDRTAQHWQNLPNSGSAMAKLPWSPAK
jgi:hypothetical protein